MEIPMDTWLGCSIRYLYYGCFVMHGWMIIDELAVQNIRILILITD